MADVLAEQVRRLALVPVAAGAALVAGIALAPKLRAAIGAPKTGRGIDGGRHRRAGRVGRAGRGCQQRQSCLQRPPGALRPSLRPGRLRRETHNSMSSPDVVRVWPEQDGDTRTARCRRPGPAHRHPSRDPARVRRPTDRGRAVPAGPGRRAALRWARTAAQRARRHLPLPQPVRAGRHPPLDVLRTVHEFLDENVDEVVTVIIQDAISPAETAEAFGAAGLDPYLHEHEPGIRWATLGELIDRGERLVVFAENEGPHPAGTTGRSSTCRTRPTDSRSPRTSHAASTVATPTCCCSC